MSDDAVLYEAVDLFKCASRLERDATRLEREAATQRQRAESLMERLRQERRPSPMAAGREEGETVKRLRRQEQARSVD